MYDQTTSINNITNWKEYGRMVRSKGCHLMPRLDEFPNSILVTGCQRSGTTMTGEVINQSDELINFAFGREISLDAALILGGYVDHTPRGRYCFQTTWLNQCYQEYLNYHNGHKIVWVLRNPLSVVRSMLYNWPVGALDELFRDCGIFALPPFLRRSYILLSQPLVSKIQQVYFGYEGKGARYLKRQRFNREELMTVDFDSSRIYVGLDRLQRACYAFNGKVSQIFDLKRHFDNERLIIIEYNDLVINKDEKLPKLFELLQIKYRPEYSDMIHSQSLAKAETLSEFEIKTIKTLCDPVFNQAKTLVTL